jgi:hypothetical protein
MPLKPIREFNWKHGNYNWYSIGYEKGEDGYFFGRGSYTTENGVVAITYSYYPNVQRKEKYHLSYDFVWKER